MATNYRRGAACEYRVMRILARAGYECTRSAGSRGCWDVFAMNAQGVRLIQVKRGRSQFSEIDREVFLAMAAPASVAKELWRFPGGRTPPVIEVL